MRACGDCTLCCTLLGIPELAKPENQTCPHQGAGCCNQYQSRPPSCRNFQCIWLTHEDFPDDFRPDRIHAVYYEAQEQPIPGKQVDIIIKLEPGFHRGQVPATLQLADDFSKQGFQVLIVEGTPPGPQPR